MKIRDANLIESWELHFNDIPSLFFIVQTLQHVKHHKSHTFPSCVYVLVTFFNDFPNLLFE